MEHVIETLASGLGNSVAWLAETDVLFGLFARIWIALGVGLVWSQGSVEDADSGHLALSVADRGCHPVS
jgi:hypothetical protein